MEITLLPVAFEERMIDEGFSDEQDFMAHLESEAEREMERIRGGGGWNGGDDGWDGDDDSDDDDEQDGEDVDSVGDDEFDPA